MRLRDRLADADRAVVPVAARAVAGWADQLAVRRKRLRAAARRPDGRLVRDLDRRFTGSGPLALVRDVPQIGFVVIAAVLLAGIATARSQEASNSRAQQVQTQPNQVVPQDGEVASGVDALGPEVGQTTTDYESVAAVSLRSAGVATSGDRRVALVSFEAYRTPAQTQTLLSAYDVARVYLRAKAAGRDAAQIPVDITGELLTDLRSAYTRTALQRRTAQQEFQGYVDTITVTTREEQSFKDLYVAYAATSGTEAREFQRGCACVYAAVVEATAGELLTLAGQPGVRAVEVAGRGQALNTLQVRPLLPEVTGVVTKQQADPGVQP